MDTLHDESNVLEYKLTLPEDAITWLKTIVSFSNTSGGELVIGIEDDTKKIVGIDGFRSELESRIMDIIFNRIAPTPIVNIVFKNIEDKDILIIQVSRGNENPYYVKSQGLVEGTYVRFGSTDRKATQSQIDEMKLSTKRLSFSTMTYKDKKNNKPCVVSKEELAQFLVELNQKNVSKNINERKLLEWELLKKHFDELNATNGYMLLTSNPFSYSYIKIGLFEGTNKAKLINEEVFNGDIIKQYVNCVNRIKEIIYEGFEFKAVRQRKYFVPEVVIREIIANAVIHRDYNDEHPIRIEIFNDRISIFSPGALYDGLQLEEILDGISKLRNKNIAEIFYNLGYIEKWGSGILRANQLLLEHNMNPLNIDAQSIHGITVTIFFERIVKEINVAKGTLPSAKDVVDIYSKRNINLKRRDLEEEFNITERQARTIIEELVRNHLVEKVGSGPSTQYIIIKDEKIS